MVIGSPELFLFVEILKLQYSLSTNHQTLNKNNLPKNPLHNIADGDQIDNGDPVEALTLCIDHGNPHHHSNEHQDCGCYGLVESESS